MNPAMKKTSLVLIAALIISTVCVPSAYFFWRSRDETLNGSFYFGVSFGLKTAQEAKVLIDKVKGYTNLFLINSWDLTTNETALNEVCNYTAKSGLSFLVFFRYVSRIIYPWHQAWMDTAKERWGDKLLGIYLYDEPGGRQIDLENNETDKRVTNASDYSDAAQAFVNSISMQNSTLDLKQRKMPMFCSDYALYWFDYLAGYDTVFVELGWNHSTTQHIALCRGAASNQGKDWGAIVTWTYYVPPYLANGSKIFEDMVDAYRAGAKYVAVFNSNYVPAELDPSGASPSIDPEEILKEEHFEAMQKFWAYVHDRPRTIFGVELATTAFVLPKDYGWGMRWATDNIWGLWPADEKAPLIWGNLNKMVTQYGLKLDIVYDDPRFDYKEKYSNVVLWNATIG